ncbi:MAG: hypothetical protein C4297_04800 [Gemmataceae bacterium]
MIRTEPGHRSPAFAAERKSWSQFGKKWSESLRHLLGERVVTFLVALGLGFLLWLYIHSREEESLDNYRVPVEVRLTGAAADQYLVELSDASEVPVYFTGPPSRIRELRESLQEGQIRLRKMLTVPDDRAGENRITLTVTLDPRELQVPAGVRAVVAERDSRINVVLRRVMEKALPVRLQHTAGDRLDEVLIEPASVLVRGPAEIVEILEDIPTRVLAVPAAPQLDEPFRVTHPVRVPVLREIRGATLDVQPTYVAVRYTVRPRLKVYELKEIPVHFLLPAGFPYRPLFRNERDGKIVLRVRGPTSAERIQILAFVDLTQRKYAAGLQPEEPIRIQLPPGFELAQEPPRLPSFELVPLAADSRELVR